MEDYLIREPTTGEKCWELWHERIEAARRYRDVEYWNGKKMWDRCWEIYKGNDKFSKYIDGSGMQDRALRGRVRVQKTATDVNTLASFIVQRKIQFVPDPQLPETDVVSKIEAKLLNYEWRVGDIDVMKEACVQDFFVAGHTVGKVGYEFPDDDVSRRNDRIDYSDFIKKNHPFLYRVDPGDFFYEYDSPTRNIDTARWAGEEFRKTPADVFNNADYNPTVLGKVRRGEPGYMPVTEEYSYRAKSDQASFGTMQSEQCDKFLLYEVWDKKFFIRRVFLAGVHEPLIEGPWPYEYLSTFPYRKADCVPMNGEPYGVSLIVWLMFQAEELNRQRTRMAQAANRIVPKYSAVKSGISREALEDFLTAEVAQVVELDNPNALNAIENPQLSQDQYQYEAIINRDHDMITGITALMSGGPLPGRTSASEVQLRGNYGNIRISDKIERINRWIKECAKLMLAHIKGNFTVEQVKRIVGIEGEYWPSFTKEEIEGEFDCDIEITDAPDMSPAMKQQMASKLFTDLVNTMPLWLQQGQQFNFTELLKFYLGTFGFKETSRFFPASGVINGPIQTMTEVQAQQQAAQQQAQQPSQGAQQGEPVSPEEQAAAMQGAAGEGGIMSQLFGGAMGGSNGQK